MSKITAQRIQSVRCRWSIQHKQRASSEQYTKAFANSTFTYTYAHTNAFADSSPFQSQYIVRLFSSDTSIYVGINVYLCVSFTNVNVNVLRCICIQPNRFGFGFVLCRIKFIQATGVWNVTRWKLSHIIITHCMFLAYETWIFHTVESNKRRKKRATAK